jgi:hypothetical protein
LAALGVASPVALWLRGSADLRFACLRSVSVVGSRAATGYGSHVGMEMAAALAERGWVIVSGGPKLTETTTLDHKSPDCTACSVGVFWQAVTDQELPREATHGFCPHIARPWPDRVTR